MKPAKTLSIACIVLPFILAASARVDVLAASNIDHGWRFWLDPNAAWRDYNVYLSEDVNLGSLPVHSSTGGWSVLSESAGIGVSLPATVEEYYFGKPPARTANSTRPAEIVAADGNYLGVSRWYRPFTPPDSRSGQRLVFYFPAGRAAWNQCSGSDDDRRFPRAGNPIQIPTAIIPFLSIDNDAVEMIRLRIDSRDRETPSVAVPFKSVVDRIATTNCPSADCTVAS